LLARVACALAVASVTACTPADPTPASAGRLEVVATTGMIADAARVVGGDRVSVTGLMGPGVDPHLYLASRGDQRRLNRAGLVLYHGLHLEGKMTELLRGLAARNVDRGQSVVAVGDAVPDRALFRNEALSEYPDPHVWFDLDLWQAAVRAVIDALAARDPAGAAAYRERGAAYLEELATAHAWAREEIGRIPVEHRKLVTSHDAYNYFGRAYGIDVRGLQGISTETRAGLDEIRKAVQFIKRWRLPVIFAETSVPRDAVEQVAREARCQVSEHELYSDALGRPGTAEESLLGVFRHNVRTIVTGLAGDGN